MGTYCYCCDRKVTSAEYPTSCDCKCGDGYCYMCVFENESGIEIYIPEIEELYVKDKNGNFNKYTKQVYTKIIKDWECKTCGKPLDFTNDDE